MWALSMLIVPSMPSRVAGDQEVKSALVCAVRR
jgi:hypothetical protein